MATISVATLNLNGWRDHWLVRRGLLVAEILDVLPDMISLQEVYRPIEQARWLRNQINSRLTGTSRGPYQLIQRRKRNLLQGLFEGIAVLTRLPVLSHDHFSLGYGGDLALRVNVELPTRESLDFVAIKMNQRTGEQEAGLEQVLKLQGWLQDRDIAPLRVIAGDFGESPTGLAISQMEQAYRSVFKEVRGQELIATYPTALASTANDQSACLDYIFLSPAVSGVLDAHLFCKKPSIEDPCLYPSNHIGLLATLDINH
jgi:endonuclease/exonuclease/phosphatase family metal-dependent hydrolase